MIVFTRTPCAALSIASEWLKALMPGLRDLVGGQRDGRSERGDRGDVHDRPGALLAHHRHDRLAGQQAALEVDRDDSSKASSVSFSGPASPVPMPTLFWRKSIRPQASMQAAANAWQSAALGPIGGHALGDAALARRSSRPSRAPSRGRDRRAAPWPPRARRRSPRRARCRPSRLATGPRRRTMPTLPSSLIAAASATARAVRSSSPASGPVSSGSSSTSTRVDSRKRLTML